MKVWEILKRYGAVKNAEVSDYQICRLHIPLPYSRYCANIWRDEKHDRGRNDLRNNMIGAFQAEIILKMDNLVNLMKDYATFLPPDILATAVRRGILNFVQNYNVSEADITMEYHLTFHAPISKDFPPPASVIPLVDSSGRDEL